MSGLEPSICLGINLQNNFDEPDPGGKVFSMQRAREFTREVLPFRPIVQSTVLVGVRPLKLTCSRLSVPASPPRCGAQLIRCWNGDAPGRKGRQIQYCHSDSMPNKGLGLSMMVSQEEGGCC